MWFFYLTMLITLGSGLFFYLKGKGGYLYAGLSVLTFIVSLISIVSFISLYIYELPTHHCPFCIIMEEYGYIGYLLYIPLFGAVVAGMGAGILIPFREVESLKPALNGIINKLTLGSILLFGVFTLVATYQITFSNLIM